MELAQSWCPEPPAADAAAEVQSPWVAARAANEGPQGLPGIGSG